MALVTCPDCQSSASDEAFRCPQCGKLLRKPKRSVFGKIIKWAFILFNLLMLVWLISGIGGSSEVYSTATSDAERAGAAIGTGIGVMLILILWGVGDMILGLFVLLTRPKSS